MLGGFGAYRSRLVQGCSAYCTNRVRVGVGCPTHRTPHLPAAANAGSILQRAWLRQHPVTRTPGPATSTVQRCYGENWAICGSMAQLHSQQTVAQWHTNSHSRQTGAHWHTHSHSSQTVAQWHTHSHSRQAVAQWHTHTHSRQTVAQWHTHAHSKIRLNGTPTLTADKLWLSRRARTHKSPTVSSTAHLFLAKENDAPQGASVLKKGYLPISENPHRVNSGDKTVTSLSLMRSTF